jgi:hypothetical protein
MLQLHPIAVRLLAVLVLVAGLGMAATAYLSSAGRSQDRAAVMNVRTAAAAADAWFQDPLAGDGSYRKLDTAGLIHEAPSVSSSVHITPLANGAAYCLDDEEEAGHSAYYVGGAVQQLRHLAGAATLTPTLDRSTTADAASVCAAIS